VIAHGGGTIVNAQVEMMGAQTPGTSRLGIDVGQTAVISRIS
jgi:hypothetical protein